MAVMEVTETQRQQLKLFFEATRPVGRLLATTRSRRVARGYSIESGEPEPRGATGRTVVQERGPLAFKSEHPVLPLTEVEEAIVAWSACGPNGMIHWDIAVHGGFHELTAIWGRTVPTPGNSCASDLLVIKDDGAFIYNPGTEREKMVEIQGEEDYDKVLRWYREGMHRVSDTRPDIDWNTRAAGAPNAFLFGPYQFNLNREGQTWFIPITDIGWLYFSILTNLFDIWHLYFVDDQTQEPAGLAPWVKEGQLEFPITISQIEQFIYQVETYPPGGMVQNMRLAAESMGLGNWVFCGYFDDVLMGAYPEVARGLQFQSEPLNEKAPLACGALKIYGVQGVKEAHYVPSPRFPNGDAIIKHHMDEKYGKGGTMSPGADNWILTHKGPWSAETLKTVLADPVTKVSEWAIEAAIAYVDYCVDRYGQCPVYFNPMQCNFGGVVHHVDEAFYEKLYGGVTLTPQLRDHMRNWH
jgi:hypothetical protein